MTTYLDLLPKADAAQSAKDFKSDQEVRWCPGCGDYVILNTIRNFLPELGLRRGADQIKICASGGGPPSAARSSFSTSSRRGMPR